MKFALILMALLVCCLVGVCASALAAATTAGATLAWGILLVLNLGNAYGLGRLLAYEFID